MSKDSISHGDSRSEKMVKRYPKMISRIFYCRPFFYSGNANFGITKGPNVDNWDSTGYCLEIIATK